MRNSRSRLHRSSNRSFLETRSLIILFDVDVIAGDDGDAGDDTDADATDKAKDADEADDAEYADFDCNVAVDRKNDYSYDADDAFADH